MRIAQFVNTLAVSDGGPARNSFELNVSLNQLDGVHADLYSMTGSLMGSVVEEYGGAAGPLPLPGPRWLKMRSVRDLRQIGLRNLHRSLQGVDVAIIHGYYLPWLPLLGFFLRRIRIPYVITPHGSLTSHQQRFSRRRKSLYEATVGTRVRKSALGFVTGSPVEREELKTKFPSAYVEVGGVGTVTPGPPSEGYIWHHPLRLLSMSRIAPKKRVDVSIAAVAVLKRCGIHAHLTVAGDGSPELIKALKNTARQLDISKQINFAGQVSGLEKEKVFRQSDVFLLPSEDENFGIGLAEALAHGLPAVTTNAVAAARFMTESTGRVLSEATPETVAEAIQAVAGGKRQEYAVQAWKCARYNYSWSAISRQWITALESLLAQSPLKSLSSSDL